MVDFNLDFNLDLDNVIPSFEENVSNIVLGMLRNIHGYAGDKSNIVYLGISFIGEETSIKAFFNVNGEIFDPISLKDAKVPGVKFTTSVERRQKLFSLLEDDLQNSLLPLFDREEKELPEELWAYFDINNNSESVSLIYGTDMLPMSLDDALNNWSMESDDMLFGAIAN